MKERLIAALIGCLKRWKTIPSVVCCLLEICAVLIETSSRFVELYTSLTYWFFSQI